MHVGVTAAVEEVLRVECGTDRKWDGEDDGPCFVNNTEL